MARTSCPWLLEYFLKTLKILSWPSFLRRRLLTSPTAAQGTSCGILSSSKILTLAFSIQSRGTNLACSCRRLGRFTSWGPDFSLHLLSLKSIDFLTHKANYFRQGTLIYCTWEINVSLSSHHQPLCITLLGEHWSQLLFDITPYLELSQNTYLPWGEKKKSNAKHKKIPRPELTLPTNWTNFPKHSLVTNISHRSFVS